MITTVTVLAQAKLNLWLHVLAKEATGYHSIETLFHRLELADEVVVALTQDGERSVTCTEDVGPGEANLAYRAAELYCSALDWNTGFDIQIKKRIPARGGLGGGSSDAAATLLAMNAMSHRRLGEMSLAALGSQLGADVPFLLTGVPMALAWGRGDRLLKLDALPQRYVALAVPPFGISTADAYMSFSIESRRVGQLSMQDITDWSMLATMAYNDLSQSRAAREQPLIGRAMAALRSAGAILAEMTGSGSVVFGIFDAEPDAAKLEEATGCQIVITRTALNVEGVSRLD
jgi:4-diphosphocytidyl-2-C-methyl-D-erythritol kinase